MIPSEEMKIAVHPMDFEEFQSAIQGNTYQLSKEVYKNGKSVGGQIHRKWMKDFRLYMAVGGMPQAVEAYLEGKNFTETEKDISRHKLPANLGYLYENAAAQMIAAAGHELYYHTWDKEKSTHYYEIDFLISQGAKVKAIEVKSSGVVRHESLKIFRKKYSKVLASSILVSSKDRKTEDGIDFLPVYMLDFAANNIEIN